MTDKTPWHAKLALALAIFLPLFFMGSALGAKFGLWSWQTGLGTLTRDTGTILLGGVALLSLISLIVVLWRAPRKGWVLPLIGLLVPLGIFYNLNSVGDVAAANPIYDVATDTDNPPALSAALIAERESNNANPLNDYATPLGQLDMWSGASEPLASQSYSDIIKANYPDLGPLDTRGKDPSEVSAIVSEAMTAKGYTDITVSEDGASVEGLATTFWYGFKDDVVVRNLDGRMDFRSVSRVGRSDLGANAARIASLRAEIESRLGE